MSKPLFTTRHYKVIAVVLNAQSDYKADEDSDILFGLIIENLADKFQKDNPKFSRKKFLKAVYKS